MKKIDNSYLVSLSRIRTFSVQAKENGYVLPLVNIHEGTLPIEQVYITVVEPGHIKGPHLHEGTKCDRFFCISGSCVVVCQNDSTKEYSEFLLSEDDDSLLIIPPYNSHALVSLRAASAAILSMPNEGYNSQKPYNQIETQYKDYDWEKWL